jgi:hypothetical protein
MAFDGYPCPPPLVSTAQIAHIAQLPDPARRNLQITQSYHDLTVAIGRRMGRRDVGWTGFAVWASKTAGRFIRGEWLRDALRRTLERAGLAHAGRLSAIDDRVRRSVALGNQLVYAEIAPLFATLVRLFDTPAHERPAHLARARAALRPGPVEAGGQAALAQALEAMVEASTRPVGPERSQLLLLANLLIGAHEQYRLQAALVGGLDVAWEVMPTPRTPWQRALQRRLAARVRQQLTRWMVRVEFPGTTFTVGRDLPALPDGSMFPADLAHIVRPDLAAIVRRFDRDPTTTTGSAAADWTDYGDRMNYVADFFRTRQQTPALWQAPFEPDQARAIRCGQIPAGPL